MTVPGAEVLTITLLALLCDTLIAGLPGLRRLFAVPTGFINILARWFDARLNRPHRSASSRKFRGAASVVVLLCLALGLGSWFDMLLADLQRGWMGEIFLVATMLTQRRGFETAWMVRRALIRDDLDAARVLLGREVTQKAVSEDAHGLARGAIEICAMRFCDGAVAPIFWYIMLGLPGLFAFRAINVMAHSLRDQSGLFGMTASRLDRVLNILLAPLCGVVMCVSAAFCPAVNPVQAFKTMISAVQGRAAFVAPWTVGALAGALSLSLGGPRSKTGVTGLDVWIGDGRARALPQDIGRAIIIYCVSVMISATAILILALYAAGRF